MFNEKEFYCENENCLMTIEGIDRFTFIQGIITNDIEKLRKNTSIYSGILSPQGKFLTDFFITSCNDKFYLECHKSQEEEIKQKLLMYKLRSSVEIKSMSKIKILLLNTNKNSELLKKNTLITSDDPRFNNFLSRSYVDESFYKNILSKMKEIKKSEYENLRISNQIPDFQKDTLGDKTFPLEMHFDKLNGISWSKGCYLGQEVTARMKHRKVVKKKIFFVTINFKENLEKDIFFNKKKIGELVSNNKKYGFAYISCDFMSSNQEDLIICGNSEIKLSIPWWVN